MSGVYELARIGPEREEGIRQLIVNLQQQNRQLAADRDRHAAWMIEARAESDRLRAERDAMLASMQTLWDTYIPGWAPDAAIEAGDDLHPAWRLIAKTLIVK